MEDMGTLTEVDLLKTIAFLSSQETELQLHQMEIQSTLIHQHSKKDLSLRKEISIYMSSILKAKREEVLVYYTK